MIKPMLAHRYEKVKKIKYPYYIQKKYNGVRCITSFDTVFIDEGLFRKEMGLILMRSKEGARFIVKHLLESFVDLYKYNGEWRHIIFDGELYVHGEPINMTNSRIPRLLSEDRISAVSRSPEPLTYIIFDIFNKEEPDMPQSDRFELLHHLYEDFLLEYDKLIVADLAVVANEQEAFAKRDEFILEGYEGAMLRSMDSEYQQKRSRSLLKLKKIYETECKILDIVDDGFKSDRENIGFILQNDVNDEVFKCTPGNDDASWDNAYKRSIYENRHYYIGKLATITYRERSGVKQVPFHANVKIIRDYE